MNNLEKSSSDNLEMLAADVIRSIDAFQMSVHNDFASPGHEIPAEITSILQQFSEIQRNLSGSALATHNGTKSSNEERDRFQVANSHIQKQYADREPDFLYHLGLVVSVDHTAENFHDIQYVCVGGTPSRMQDFAVYCLDALRIQVPSGLGVTDLCGGHARYVMYKAGPVLTVSHGMGNPSLSIMLHEVLKLLHYARANKGVKFIRIGTCGGVGVEAGTTVITENVYNGLFQNYYEQHVFGQPVRRPTILDQQLRQDLIYHASKPEMNIPVISGNTLCANDFYEEQGRIDGAFCEFSHHERIGFLEKCSHAYGIRNIEMESLAFSALTHQAKVQAAVVCVVLVNRLMEDKVSTDAAIHLDEWQRRPQRLVAELIRSEVLKKTTEKYPDQKLHVLREKLARASRLTKGQMAIGKSHLSSERVGSDSSEDSAVSESPVDSRADSPHESRECLCESTGATMDMVVPATVLQNRASDDVVRK